MTINLTRGAFVCLLGLVMLSTLSFHYYVGTTSSEIIHTEKDSHRHTDSDPARSSESPQVKSQETEAVISNAESTIVMDNTNANMNLFYNINALQLPKIAESGLEFSDKSKYILPTTAHTATVIWLHGLGDRADGWYSHFQSIGKELPYIRFVFPNAPLLPVSLNGGRVMTAWHDLKSLDAAHFDENFPFGYLNETKLLLFKLIQTELIRLNESLYSNSNFNSNSDGESDSECEASEININIIEQWCYVLKRMIIGGFSQGSAMSMLLGLDTKNVQKYLTPHYIYPYSLSDHDDVHHKNDGSSMTTSINIPEKLKFKGKSHLGGIVGLSGYICDLQVCKIESDTTIKDEKQIDGLQLEVTRDIDSLSVIEITIPKMLIYHGKKDRLVPPKIANFSVKYIENECNLKRNDNFILKWHESGHTGTPQELIDVQEFFQNVLRDNAT